MNASFLAIQPIPLTGLCHRSKSLFNSMLSACQIRGELMMMMMICHFLRISSPRRRRTATMTCLHFLLVLLSSLCRLHLLERPQSPELQKCELAQFLLYLLNDLLLSEFNHSAMYSLQNALFHLLHLQFQRELELQRCGHPHCVKANAFSRNSNPL